MGNLHAKLKSPSELAELSEFYAGRLSLLALIARWPQLVVIRSV